ncbi:helix-turn-helix domain-containing protein [Paenibacillus sp. FSL W8-0187]|uniref:TetR/AcrR family transcriptional regulator n=1 Tax=Paenibacillus sp. FSL W8-0187 TaxID=2921710 RepID=UPI0030D7101D
MYTLLLWSKVAECVFTHKGIETATMQDVATEAKMGIATIFRFFPRKEKLVVAIATKKLETVLETFRSIAERLRSAFSPESCPSPKKILVVEPDLAPEKQLASSSRSCSIICGPKALAK